MPPAQYKKQRYKGASIGPFEEKVLQIVVSLQTEDVGRYVTYLLSFRVPEIRNKVEIRA